jgi:dipeptidyl aminopeptidase/acylaminoacyl peptidase
MKRLTYVATCVGVGLLIWNGPVARTVAAESQRAARPLTIEDYYRVQTVGGVAISPDGRWAAFTVSTRIEATNGTSTESYVVPADASSAPRRIQHEGKDVSAPGFTADGRLRYTVDRQAWTTDAGNPAAAPVRAEAGAAGTVSPDGKWSVQLRDKARPPATSAPPTDFERRHAERFKGAIFDWMEFQRDGQPFPAPDPAARPAQQIVLRGVTGGKEIEQEKVLFDQDLRPTGLVWHPGSTRMAFVADPVWREEIKYERPDIWMVTTDGRATRLTDDGYVYGDLEFSPDGRYLSYARTFGTDMVIAQKLNHGGPRDLFIRPVDGGEAVNVTAAWDLEPGNTSWSPDGHHIYFTAAVGGESHLFRVAVPQAGQPARVEQVTKGARRLNGLVMDRGFTTIAYTVGLNDEPADVFAARIDGTGERRLSNVHRELKETTSFGRTERVQWKSHDGTPIEGWVTLPPGYDRARGPYPLIVFSHGGPHAATGYAFDFKKQFFAANGYVILDTNFRSSTGYGDAFKWATWGEWGKKDGEDVVSGIDYVLKTYAVDRSRVGHTGHSYGGFMTNWLITQYPDRFAAAVTGAGISNWISDYGTADIFRTKETEFYGPPWDEAARARMIKQSPLSYAGRVRTPTLFIHGEVDQRVPYEEGEQMYFALKRRGVPAKMIQYAGQPHGIAGHWNNVHRMLSELQWWNTYLKDAKDGSK